MPSHPDHEGQRDLFSLTIRASRRRLLGLLGGVSVALAFALVGERAAGQEATSEKKSGGYHPDHEERKFLDLINAYRRKHGAKPLSLQKELGAAAEHHSRDMAKKNYFSHTLANGDSFEENIRRFGYRHYYAVGENIAAGDKTAKQVMKTWQKSHDHARNMRSTRFTEIGIGRASNRRSKYGWYWTTTFGSRG